MKRGLLLFAHGARDPEWATPAKQIQSAIQAALPDVRVELAFLEFISPSLDESMAALIGDGVLNITLLPLFIAPGGHLKHDLPLMLGRLKQKYPTLQIALEPTVGELPAVQDAITRYALSVLSSQSTR